MQVKHFDNFEDYRKYYGQGDHIFDDKMISINETFVSYKVFKINPMHISPVNSIAEKQWMSHRLDGPAFISQAGTKLWIFNNLVIDVTLAHWAERYDIDLDNLSETEIILIYLTWNDYDGNNSPNQ